MKKLIVILFCLGLLQSCSKSSENETMKPTNENPKSIEISKISGYIQKGPYVNGTGIVMHELDDTMTQTGKSFTTQINSNDGKFEISDINLSSEYVELSANGFYFDEVKGEISSSQLNLYALSNVQSVSDVNVNLLTHLEKQRVEHLIEEGHSFEEAKKMAQKEILAIFNIHEDDLAPSELLDISKDAILLTISSILQGNRSVGELTELLASISSDIAEDGVLDDTSILEQLRQSALNLDPSQIRNNLVERYESLGIEVTIPVFENYVEGYLNFTATNPEITNVEVNVITADSIAIISRVMANNSETEVIFEYGVTESLNEKVVFSESPINGSNVTSLSLDISGLKPATTYHYQVSASNEFGNVNSPVDSFTTLGGLPEEIGNLTLVAGTHKIEVQGAVNPNYLETEVHIQFIEYQQNFEQADSVKVDQSPISPYSDGNITALIEDLKPGTRYWVRLKLENEIGVTYGDPMDIYTLGSAPNILIFDIAGGQPKANSVETYIEIGENTLSTQLILEYSTSNTFDNSVKYLDTLLGPSAQDIGFLKKINGLEMDQNYFVRLTLKNDVGEDSSELIFKTLDGIIKFSELMYDSTYSDPEIHLYVNIKEDGGLAIQERGLLYSLSPGLTLENSNATRIPDPGSNDSHFTTYLPDLEPGKIYYARGYAFNESGVFYTNEIEFESLKLPEVATVEVRDVTSNSAWVMGTVISNGGSSGLITGVCWSKNPNVTIDDSKITGDGEKKDFTIENLEPNTQYYVRFFGQNGAGTSYGEELQFVTNPE